MLEGLHPNRPTHVLRLSTTEAAARAMTDLLGEVFDPAETAVAAFEAEDGGPWLIEAYFASPPDEAAVLDLIRPIVGGAVDKARFESLAEKDWVAASLEGLTPVRAGRFLVHGAHDRGRRRANDWALEIEAALAFGTGHHGTTRGCLLALSAELKRRRPRQIIDVGAGTGVLAMAAAKALRRRVFASDIDPVAVAAARSNARLNGVASLIRFAIGPGVRPEALRGHQGYDLAFANILARPLRRLAPSLARALSRDATLVLSGLQPRDVRGVLSAYAAQGLRLGRRLDLDGWATLVLSRGGTLSRRERVRAERGGEGVRSKWLHRTPSSACSAGTFSRREKGRAARPRL